MRKFLRQETIDLYADACDCCGEIVYSSGCAIKLSHKRDILFCYKCASDLVKRISDMPTIDKTLGELLDFDSTRP